MSSRFKAWVFLSAIFSATWVISAQAEVWTDQPQESIPDRIPGEFIVKYRDAASSRGSEMLMTQALGTRLGNDSIQDIRPLETDSSLAVVTLRDESLLHSAFNILSGVPAVEYIEPNYLYHTMDMLPGQAEANDKEFARQWSFSNTGQADSAGHRGIAGDDINILPLWNQGIVGKKETVVAIIDTGIQWNHPDLKENLYTNPGEIYGNRKDDDRNGYVDDIHGWNFNKKNNNTDDDNGHGSHCAGVIGAAHNKTGVVGINWKVSMMPVKFLNKKGQGSLADALNAINYARMMKVKVMSNSWGGGGYSQAMYDAIKAAKDDGILFVAAAGNNGASNEGNKASYPASYDLPNVISVAATDNRDAIASFSNYGATKVHVAAPGVNIYSTFNKKKYRSLSGTSMAAPHVAGISALLLSEYPNWTPEEVKDRLIKTSTPVAGLAEKVVAKGRVNAAAALSGKAP